MDSIGVNDDGTIELDPIFQSNKKRYSDSTIDYDENKSKLIAALTIDSNLEKLDSLDLINASNIISLKEVKKLFKIIVIYVDDDNNIEKEIQINSSNCQISIEKLKDLFSKLLQNDSDIKQIFNENNDAINSTIPNLFTSKSIYVW